MRGMKGMRGYERYERCEGCEGYEGYEGEWVGAPLTYVASMVGFDVFAFQQFGQAGVVPVIGSTK